MDELMIRLKQVATKDGLAWSDLDDILYILDYGKVDIFPRPEQDEAQNELNMCAELVIRKIAGLLRE